MEFYGYGQGSLSKAAEDAFERWTAEYEALLKKVEVPDDPAGAIRDMFKGVRKGGEEPQHKARIIRAAWMSCKFYITEKVIQK